MTQKVIAFTGGGSGGHVMPALSLIQALQKNTQSSEQLKILYLGSYNGIEHKILSKENLVYKKIHTGKLRRYFSIKNLTDIIFIFFGFIQSYFILKKNRPNLLISTGGFVSVPPVIAAKFNKIPVIIHEQTIDAGLANKIASRFATQIAITFEESKKYFPPQKTQLTGIPLRESLFNGKKENLFSQFKLDPEIPLIYFTGGGLGCHLLNQAALQIIPQLLKSANIIYQSGNSPSNNDYQELASLHSQLPDSLKQRFILFDFINDELPDILNAANLAVARSGAGTVNEFLALKIPALFIPLAIATNDEQTKNAQVMTKLGAAQIIREDELNDKTLYNSIMNLLKSNRLKSMKEKLVQYNQQNGTEKLLALINQLSE